MCKTPQKVPLDESIDLANVQMISGGGGHLLLLDKNGRMYGCGWNGKGQLALCNTVDASSFQPLLKTDSPIVDIACGWDSSAAIDQDGNLYVWGSNTFDQLGFNARFIDTFFTIPMILNLPSNEKAKKVCFGLRFMCILCESQKIYIVGRWRYLDTCKVITHNDTNFHQLLTPPNLTINHISSGTNHIVCACTEKTDSTGSAVMIGFGDNKFSQCNEQILLDADIRYLRSGWSHNGILTDSGSVFLWGRNTYGQLANSDGDKSDELVVLKGVEGKVQQFHLGSEHGLVVTESNDVFTWGWNEHGNCGNGNETNL